VRFLREVVDTILPAGCSVCGAFPDADGKISFPVPSGFHICFNCLSEIIPQPSDKRFFPCLSEPFTGDPCAGLALYMPYTYKGFFEKAVPRVKFKSKPELASFMGILLGRLMKRDGITADVIVPIPLSDKRFKERGYNQAALIAQEVSRIAGVPMLENLLTRNRDTLRQTEITDSFQRSTNVSGAFDASEDFDFEGTNVIILDDVATTGNTLHEAATTLKNRGVSKILCVAVCGNRAVLNCEPY